LAETEISTAAVHRLIKKGGAGRIGDDAAEELRKVVEEVAVRVGKEASGIGDPCRAQNS